MLAITPARTPRSDLLSLGGDTCHWDERLLVATNMLQVLARSDLGPIL